MHTDHDKRRFWPRVKASSANCWEWTGGIRDNGYGGFSIKRADGSWTKTCSHRWSYEDQVGPIPDGYEVDHLCRNRACLRPDHLEAVTLQENRRRRDVGYSPAVNRNPLPLPVAPPVPALPPRRNPQTHCKRWHEIAVVGRVKNGDKMTCRACRDVQTVAKRKGGAHGTETYCPQGHPYDEANTLIRTRPDGSKQRECKTCVYARNQAARDRRKTV